MSFATALRDLRRSRGYTQQMLANALGISKSAVSMYEHGERMPTWTTICTIADLFDVEIDCLSGKPTSASAEEHTRRLPVLGSIACGEPIFAVQDNDHFITVGNTFPADFCLTARGDSMIGARIYDGDTVFIRSQPTVENGQIAAVIIGDEATLKRWYYYPEQAKLILTPENPAYEPLVFVGSELEDVRCLGQAVSFMSNL